MTLTLHDLTIGYRDGRRTHRVAGPLTATLRSGTLTCLTGRNGTGKSTLLRTLAGFQPALEGTMLLDGRDMGTLARRERAATVSVVLTDRAEPEGLTARQVVAMGRTPYTNFWGTLGDDDRRMVDEAMEAVDIVALAPKAMTQLSDGERQKVMIAKALAQQTPLILLDEPTAFLDYPSKQAVTQLLHDLAARYDKMVLLSTHDLDIALRVADGVWHMDGGTLSTLAPDEAMERMEVKREKVEVRR